MSFREDLDLNLRNLTRVAGGAQSMLERFIAQAEFAARLAEAHPARQAEWEGLIVRAVASVSDAISHGLTVDEAVFTGEELLAPLGKAAKAYTIHCVGHAHIDMNWMWNWPETVATTNDTFTTVDRLMEEFPDFRFSQSQASVYQIMKEYLPELYDRVKRRVAEGRWEVTASQWVEGDKNMASGEIICRHLLYTRRFFRQEFGLPYNAVTIDWEPDTFGHPRTLPTILNHGGVKRYYFHRGGHLHPLFWWQAKDGSRVLAFDDWKRGYNGVISPAIPKPLFEFEKATGLKDFLFVYGVGDHGGGPTRRDLQRAREMNTWPIFPNIVLSTTDAFFAIAEAQAKDLPVVDAELNFVVEGCYTSESNIKRANRKSENALVEAEMMALLGRGLTGMPYPADALNLGWRHAMFNQFHDILPGSGVKATYEHAQGLFQEIMAQTTMIKTRALRAIAARVNTAALCACRDNAGADMSLGAGQGDMSAHGSVSRRGGGDTCCDPFVIFNPTPWTRSEVVATRIWDRDYADEEIAVTDDAGNTLPAQVIERGNFWGHRFIGVAFPAPEIAGLGYRTFNVSRSINPGAAGGVTSNGYGTMENEFLRVEVEQASGAIIHLIDKRTGIDLVPSGERIGLLEYQLETPHPMTAWVLGQIVKTVPFTEGAVIDCPWNGPHLATVRAKHNFQDSTFTMCISLAAGSPRVEFTLDVNWLERGSPETGVPALRVAFPLAVNDGIAAYECPNGDVRRSTTPADLPAHTNVLHGWYFPRTEPIDREPGEVPAQKWADLTGRRGDTDEPVGATLLNDSKYGHSTRGNTLRLTLLRSSYDPDPLPELGAHAIRFALQPHIGPWSACDATRAGYAFNLPCNVVGTSRQEGTLPVRNGFAELLTPNVMLSGMKKTEDDDALIVRLYEMEGTATRARLKLNEVLAPANANAVQTDAMEQPLAGSTARMVDGILEADLPALGMITVRIG